MIDRAKTLVPVLKERAPSCETLRRIPDETIADLKKNRIFDCCKPAEFGGFEQSWDVHCEVIRELAKGCASTAWVTSVYGEFMVQTGNLSLQAQRDVWGDNPSALICSGNSPHARLTPVESGFILNGEFQYSSGCDHVDWHNNVARLEDGKTAYFVLTPAKDREIIRDWNTFGLAGTGSNSIIIRDKFIPGHRTLRTTEPGYRAGEKPLFRQSQFSMNAFILASVAIGCAMGALEEFTAEMRQRSSRFGSKIAEFQSLQLRIAESAAELDAAWRIALHDVRESIKYLESHDTLDQSTMVRNKRDFAYVTQLCVRAIDRIFYAGGANALFVTAPIQRAFRDVHAAASQLILNWDVNGTLYGKIELGVDPGFVRW